LSVRALAMPEGPTWLVPLAVSLELSLARWLVGRYLVGWSLAGRPARTLAWRAVPGPSVGRPAQTLAGWLVPGSSVGRPAQTLAERALPGPSLGRPARTPAPLALPESSAR